MECILTEEERKHLKNPKEKYARQWDKRVRDKARAMIGDLAFVAKHVSPDQFEKIFTEDETRKLIRKITLPKKEPENPYDIWKYYRSNKARFLEETEDCREKIREFTNEHYWKPLDEALERSKIGPEYYKKVHEHVEEQGQSDVTMKEAIEIYEREVNPKELILRTCSKWLNLGKIGEETGLLEEKAKKYRDELLDEGKLVKQANGYRYKSRRYL